MTDEAFPELIDAEDKDQFDPDQDIVSCDPDDIDVDVLYDLRREAEELDSIAMAFRVEIERLNSFTYDNYEPQFAQHELMEIGLMLMHAKQHRYERGDTARKERISEISSLLLKQLEEPEVVEQ